MNESPPRLPPPPSDRSKGWVCLVTNLLVCPGVGSLMAGRRSGFAELGLALTGTLWMAIALVRLFSLWIQLNRAPPDASSMLRSGMGGLTLFLASWLWSLATGLSVLRQSRRNAPGG